MPPNQKNDVAANGIVQFLWFIFSIFNFFSVCTKFFQKIFCAQAFENQFFNAKQRRFLKKELC